MGGHFARQWMDRLPRSGNLSLRIRIFGLIFVSLTSTALLGGFSIHQLQNIGLEIRMLMATSLPISRTLAGIRIHELDHTLLLLKSGDDLRTEAARKRHLEARDKFLVYMDAMDAELTEKLVLVKQAIANADHSEFLPYFKKVAHRLQRIDDRYHRLTLQIQTAFAQQDALDREGLEQSTRDILQDKAELLEEKQDLSWVIQDMTGSSLAQMEEEYGRILRFLYGAMAVVILFLFLLARLVLLHIMGPLQKAIETVDALTQDNPHGQTAAGGEMGQLLAVVDHLAETMRERDELRRRLAIAEKMSSIGRLAVGVAHEINNPLANATIGLQNLQKKLHPLATEPEIQKKIEQVERNIQRAALVARDMLEFAWTGQLTLEPVAICELLESLLEGITMQRPDLAVQTHWHEHPMVQGDCHKIERIFRNLLENSLDAMPATGLLTLSVTLRFPRWVVIAVADSGDGILPENLGKVAEPFFTTKPPGRGTGLGLPICESLVAQHRGKMEILSTPGRGTKVVVSLPAWREHP